MSSPQNPSRASPEQLERSALAWKGDKEIDRSRSCRMDQGIEASPVAVGMSGIESLDGKDSDPSTTYGVLSIGRALFTKKLVRGQCVGAQSS